MSVCQMPFDECQCSCHVSGQKHCLLGNPPILCCDCPSEGHSLFANREQEIESVDLSELVKKMDELWNWIQAHDADNQDLDERMDKIENQLNDHDCKLDGLKSQVEELTEMYKHISIGYSSLTDKVIGRKPYKCPVCDGNGFYLQGSNKETAQKKECHVCDGKGIVWG